MTFVDVDKCLILLIDDENMIKFSIIVPCYNSAKFLSTCVKGFQNQKFGKDKYEVIFIDDCSTDDTLNILYRYDKNTDFSYRVIKNKINSGPGFHGTMQLHKQKENIFVL